MHTRSKTNPHTSPFHILTQKCHQAQECQHDVRSRGCGVVQVVRLR